MSTSFLAWTATARPIPVKRSEGMNETCLDTCLGIERFGFWPAGARFSNCGHDISVFFSRKPFDTDRVDWLRENGFKGLEEASGIVIDL